MSVRDGLPSQFPAEENSTYLTSCTKCKTTVATGYSKEITSLYVPVSSVDMVVY